MTTSIAFSRVATLRIAAKFTSKPQARNLSTQGVQAVEKLRGVLEEYRQQNYTQTLPSRFKKELFRAAKHDDSGQIALEDMQRVLTNIHMQDKISKEEMETIFHEIGAGETRMVPKDQFMKFI